MKNVETVETLGSLWESTKESVLIAKDITEKEIAKKKVVTIKKEELRKSYNIVRNEKTEIMDLLKKAGIKATVYFPFKTKTGENGEIEFIPKNIFKMKKDSKKARKQLEEALKQNRITEEEFKMLSDNLTDMLKENGLDEEKEEEEIEVSEDEIQEMYATFNRGIDENMNGLIASIGEESFYKMCNDYEHMDLDERKNRLEQFNSKINKKLGIAGGLQFSTDSSIGFEDSFIKGGYLLTEKDVENKNLMDITRGMMEKSMVRKLMTSKNQNISAAQRKALYNKIVEQKRIQERGKTNNKGRKYEN